MLSWASFSPNPFTMPHGESYSLSILTSCTFLLTEMPNKVQIFMSHLILTYSFSIMTFQCTTYSLVMQNFLLFFWYNLLFIASVFIVILLSLLGMSSFIPTHWNHFHPPRTSTYINYFKKPPLTFWIHVNCSCFCIFVYNKHCHNSILLSQ